MVLKLVNFMKMTWAWMPTEFIVAISALVCFKFADSFMGIVDRAWRIIGR